MRGLEIILYLLIVTVSTVFGGIIGFLASVLILHWFLSARGKLYQDEPLPTKPTPYIDHLDDFVLTEEMLRESNRRHYYAGDMLRVPEDLHEEYRAYLKSQEWRDLSKLAKVRDSHRCTRCGYIGHLQVHHTNYKGIYEMSFSIDQLETVCYECHKDIHKGKLPMKKD